MLEIQLILDSLGAFVVSEVRDAIYNKSLVPGYPPPNASGKLAESLRYEATETTLKVFCLDYVYYLEFGRGKGKRPPKDAILKWIDDKGITPDGISKESLAFLIARSIGENGTLIKQQGGSDLLSDIINDELFIATRDEIADEFFRQITFDILQQSKQAA